MALIIPTSIIIIYTVIYILENMGGKAHKARRLMPPHNLGP